MISEKKLQEVIDETIAEIERDAPTVVQGDNHGHALRVRLIWLKFCRDCTE
jgi:hypothetical protein